jgi:starvation-inducible DNA-binding protein
MMTSTLPMGGRDTIHDSLRLCGSFAGYSGRGVVAVCNTGVGGAASNGYGPMHPSEFAEMHLGRIGNAEEVMFETRNDLPEPTRASMIKLLNERLAAAIDLQLQAKQAHWNVKGPNFVGLHELFDKVAGAAIEYSDSIAERAVALGGTAEGTLQVTSQRSNLPNYPVGTSAWREHVTDMAKSLGAFGTDIRRSIDDATRLNDADTADLFTEISRGIDKLLWMLEAHIQGV